VGTGASGGNGARRRAYRKRHGLVRVQDGAKEGTSRNGQAPGLMRGSCGPRPEVRYLTRTGGESKGLLPWKSISMLPEPVNLSSLAIRRAPALPPLLVTFKAACGK